MRSIWRLGLRHRRAVTLALIAVLLVNLLVVVRVQPGAHLSDELPLASHCQGGGPGCVVQPMIPPPVGGLPHIEGPVPAAFGLAIAIVALLAPAVIEGPSGSLTHPPQLIFA